MNIKQIAAWFDFLNLPERLVLPLFTLQWGCGTVDKPNLRNFSGSVGYGKHDASLFYNGVVFGRVVLAWPMLPVAWVLHVCAPLTLSAAASFFMAHPVVVTLPWWWVLPLCGGAGLHIRWAGTPPRAAWLRGREFWQCWLGYKKSGVFAVTFRTQNDASSAAGTYGHNYNQAQGWACGTH